MNRTFASVLALSLALSALTPTPSRADDDTDKAKAELELKKLKGEVEGQDIDNAGKKQKLITDALPASPTSGEITVGTNTGVLEAQGLSAAATNDLAARIVADVVAAAKDGHTGAPLVLTTGAATLTFAHYDQFKFRAQVVDKQLTDTKTEGEAALKATVRPARPPKGSSTFSLGSKSVLSALAVVDVGVKLAELALPDWAAGGVEVAKPSDRALAMAVARAYAGCGDVYWLDAVGRRNAGREVFDTLTALRDKAQAANKVSADIADRLKIVTDKGGKARLTAAAADLTTAAEAYDALIDAMNGADATLPIGKVIAEADVSKLLGDSGLVLNVTSGGAAGGYVTRKGLMNIIQPGRIPVRVAGGATVDFTLVDPNNQKVLTSGYYARQSDYVWLKQVAGHVNAPLTAAPACPAKPTSLAKS